MRVQIRVNRDQATTAIGQHLIYGNGEQVTRRNFSRIVADYVAMYGLSNLDDHDSEIEANDLSERAVQIVNQYFQ